MKKLYILIFIVLISLQSSAETMTGGGYTLNGGVDTTIGQGQGGTYTLSSNGDPLSTQNSSGGTYTLYPTPYSTAIVPVTPGSGTAVQEVIRAVVFGTRVPNYQEYYPGAILGTARPTNPSRPGIAPSKPGIGSGSGNQGGSATTTYSGSTTTTNYGGTEGSTVNEFGELVTSDLNYEYPNTADFEKGTSTFEGKIETVRKNMDWWWLLWILFVLIVLRWLNRRSS
ncbi:MAG: hypothetical protein V4686_02565 [Patescibacteria group bacterium]